MLVSDRLMSMLQQGHKLVSVLCNKAALLFLFLPMIRRVRSSGDEVQVPCRSQELRVPVNVSPDRRFVRHSSFVPCDHQGFLSPDRWYVRHESTSASSHDQQFSTPGIPHGISRIPLNDISNDVQLLPNRKRRPPLNDISEDVQKMKWSSEEEAALNAGIAKYGLSKWSKIGVVWSFLKS
ncbi:telomere repeat-binding factor 1-like protein [Tanacetum coccineum]